MAKAKILQAENQQLKDDILQMADEIRELRSKIVELDEETEPESS